MGTARAKRAALVWHHKTMDRNTKGRIMTKQLDKQKSVNADTKPRKSPMLGLKVGDDKVLRITAEGDFQSLFDILPNAQLTDGLFGQIATLGSPG
jgi:hypothetical protein